MHRSQAGNHDVPGLPEFLETFQLSVTYLESYIHAYPVVNYPVAVVDHSQDVSVDHGYGLYGADELTGQVVDEEFGVYYHFCTNQFAYC